MSNLEPKLSIIKVRHAALALVLLPLLTSLLAGAVMMIWQGGRAGLITLLGGFIWILPNLYLAWRLFANMSPRAAKRIISTFFWAEFVKLGLIVGLFLLLTRWFAIPIGPLLIGYFAAQVTFWFAPLLVFK